jgi:hypothetical protein
MVLLGCTMQDDTSPVTTSNADKTDGTLAKEKTGSVIITYLTAEHGSWPIIQDTPMLKEIKETIGVGVEFIYSYS